MEQSNPSAWDSGHNDLATTDELPQAPDWLLDEADAAATDDVELSSDTIPSPPPDEDTDVGRHTIPAPPPVGDIPTED